MPTLSEGIVATLGLNTNPYVQGVKRARDELNRFRKSGTDTGEAIKRALDDDFKAMERRSKTTFGRMTNFAIRFGRSARGAIRGFVSSTATALTRIPTLLSAATGISIGLLGRSMSEAAKDAEEAASKFKFVFDDAAASAEARLDQFAATVGRSSFALKSMAGDLGALIRPMGFTTSATAEMSVRFAQLATDLSSFFNATESDALVALRAGIVGEAEPLRRMGVQLNAAKIKQEALNLGLDEGTKTLTAAQRALAVYSIVMRETAGAQNDAARTSMSFSNQMRRLSALVEDLKVGFGQELNTAILETIKEMGGMETAIGQIQVGFGLAVGISKLFISFAGRAIKASADFVGELGGVEFVVLKIREAMLRLKFGAEFVFSTLKIGVIILRENLKAAVEAFRAFWFASTFKFGKAADALKSTEELAVGLGETLRRETRDNRKQIRQTAAEIELASMDAQAARERHARDAARGITQSAKMEENAYQNAAKTIKQLWEDLNSDIEQTTDDSSKAVVKSITKDMQLLEQLQTKITDDRRRDQERVTNFIQDRENKLKNTIIKGWGDAESTVQEYITAIRKNATSQEDLDNLVLSFFRTQKIELADAQKGVTELTRRYQAFDATVRGIKQSANLSARELAVNTAQEIADIRTRDDLSKKERHEMIALARQREALGRGRLKFEALEKIREEKNERTKVNEELKKAQERLASITQAVKEGQAAIEDAAGQVAAQWAMGVENVSQVNAQLKEGAGLQKNILEFIQQQRDALKEILVDVTAVNTELSQMKTDPAATLETATPVTPETFKVTVPAPAGPVDIPAFNITARTDTPTAPAAGPATASNVQNVSIGDINVHTELTGDTDVDVAAIAKQLKLGIQRKQISLVP